VLEIKEVEMSGVSFTEEEKRVVFQLLQRDPAKSQDWMAYVVYLLPSLLFAAYGVWADEKNAFIVAYITLFVVVLSYLVYVGGQANALYGAVKKYESSVRALSRDTDTQV
jgi:hypothetical protein